MCDEIFSPENHIETIIWKNKYGAGAKTVGFISVHEYILCYAKHADYLNFNLDKNATVTTSYNLEDEKKVKEVLISYVKRCVKARFEYVQTIGYYILKDGMSNFATDYENFESREEEQTSSSEFII